MQCYRIATHSHMHRWTILSLPTLVPTRDREKCNSLDNLLDNALNWKAENFSPFTANDNAVGMAVDNRKMSEIQASFYPPTLTPLFMGANPPTKQDLALYEGGSINYFQNYRNETLSKFSMPLYEWGRQSTAYSSRPDVVANKMRRAINRYLTIPKNDISTIDPARMKEIDNLFKVVQLHRNQYKDRTGTSHPLTFFKADDYKYQCAPGMTKSYFSKYPQNYIKYKSPTVLPLTYERHKPIPYIPDLSLAGIYGKGTCIAYKR